MRSRFSTDITSVLLEEILKAENKCKHVVSPSFIVILCAHRLKVLVAIDGFNGLFNPTSIKTSEGNMVGVILRGYH